MVTLDNQSAKGYQMSLSYEQAQEQAVKLHNQGVPYMKIQEHLKAAGYTSSRTKKPVSYVTVRKMVTEKEAAQTKAAKAEERQIALSSPKAERLEAVKKILSLDGLSVDTQLDILRAMIKD